MKKKIEELFSRNLISQITNKENFFNMLIENKCHFYIGIDPTSDKYHIGHIVPYFLALRLLNLGAKAVILVGGFTGKIGDPSFLNKERPVLEDNVIEKNTNILTEKLKIFFKDYSSQIIFVNNNDWLEKMNLMEFLNYSNFISAHKIMKMDHIKNHIENSLPLSFKEICYTLLQAIDFFILNKNQKVNLQIGGNDQYVNIVNGIHLIHQINKNENENILGITVNLLLNKNGKKFGKTESGALWADGSIDMYEFWQFFRNISDEEVKNMFYIFSFLSKEEIDNLIEKEDINICKKILANEITNKIYGNNSYQKIEEILSNSFESKELEIFNSDIFNILIHLKFFENKSQIKRAINAGAIKINEEKVMENIILEKNKDYIITYGKNKKIKIKLKN